MTEARQITCIACPMGCRMEVGRNDQGDIEVLHATCKRGIAYGVQEYTCPMRTVTTSVRILDGMRPVCAVKTADVVPKAKIPEILSLLRALRVPAPIAVGQVLVPDVAGTGVALVATAACPAAEAIETSKAG